MKALGYSQMRINNSIDKLKSKMTLLKNELESELNRIESYKESGKDYIPNESGVVQDMGSGIDNLCGRIGALYEMKERLEGEENNGES